MVVWFGVLYLCYSGAPQSLWPWRPLIRDADRFLCGLAIPLSVLAVAGLVTLWRRYAAPRLGTAWWGRPAFLGAIALAACALITTRERFDPGYVREMRAYMAALPDGTRVFTHETMRAIAYLAGSAEARRFQWSAPNHILHRDPPLEQLAAQSDEFWYARKLVWLTTRKQLEKGRLAEQPALASYFASPEREWRLARLLARGDTPDLIFCRRRTADSPPARVLEPGAPEFAGLIPPLPIEWTGRNERVLTRTWNVPENLRGQYLSLQLAAASDSVEALTIRLRFARGREPRAEFLLKPYLYPAGGREFFSLPIPAEAETCEVQLKLATKARPVRFTALRAVVENPSAR
jgi:hypothetical protein